MQEYELSYAEIDKISDDLSVFYTSAKVGKHDAIKLRLTLEEILLFYRDSLGEKTKIKIETKKTYSKVRVKILVPGSKQNPLTSTNSETLMNSLLSAYTESPVWKYSSEINEITLSAHRNKKMGDIALIGLFLLAGILFALLSNFMFGEETYRYFVGNYIDPLKNAYDGILCVMAILLTFFSFAIGIVNLGSASGFGKIGKKFVKDCVVITLLVTVAASLAVLPKITLSSTELMTDFFKPVFDVFISFVPTNVVAPFLNFNCMQIIVIGCMFGFSFITMGEKSTEIVSVFNQCNLVAVITNNYLAKLIPPYVFLTVVSLFSLDYSAFLSELFFIFVIVIVLGILLLVGYSGYICIKYKVNFNILWKKFLPVFMINLSSASFGASFVHNFNMLSNECGVDGPVVGVTLNAGCVLYKPLYGTFLAISAIFMASTEGLTVSVPWILLVIIISAVFTCAIPNIPGGAASIIVLMFAQFGISSSSTSLIISLNAVLQFFIIAVNIFCLGCETVIAGASGDLVNLEKLRKPTPER